VFIWDIETYLDGDRWAKTYAVGLFPLASVDYILGPKLNSEHPVHNETLEKLKRDTKIFTEEIPIIEMFKYLGQLNLENVTLIAHDGKGFDNWVLSESGLVAFQMLKTGPGLVDMRIKNPHTAKEYQDVYKQNFMERKKMRNDPQGGAFLQTVTFRCSYNNIKCSLAKLCESYKLPSNLWKTELCHDDITRENFMEKRGEWQKLFTLRKKFKDEGNKVGYELIKLLLNSLHGKTVH
jgi:hypothetical protein